MLLEQETVQHMLGKGVGPGGVLHIDVGGLSQALRSNAACDLLSDAEAVE